MLTIHSVLLVVAAILALIAAFPIPTGSVKLLALSVAFLEIAFLVA